MSSPLFLSQPHLNGFTPAICFRLQSISRPSSPFTYDTTSQRNLLCKISASLIYAICTRIYWIFYTILGNFKYTELVFRLQFTV